MNYNSDFGRYASKLMDAFFLSLKGSAIPVYASVINRLLIVTLHHRNSAI
jgi:hypothetical protein